MDAQVSQCKWDGHPQNTIAKEKATFRCVIGVLPWSSYVSQTVEYERFITYYYMCHKQCSDRHLAVIDHL